MRVENMPGVEVARATQARDNRGWFAEVTQIGGADYRRMMVAHNIYQHTLRGIHYRERAAEYKLVACVAGLLLDVVVDLRQERWLGYPWTSFVLQPGDSVRVPAGCAHGYMTLAPSTSVAYLVTQDEWDDDDARGIRWDDPAVGIDCWPREPVVISDRDASWPRLKP